MRKIEWLVVLLLIGSGLICLSMASMGVGMEGMSTEFLRALLKVCLWTAIPIAAIGVLYAIYQKRKK